MSSTAAERLAAEGGQPASAAFIPITRVVITDEEISAVARILRSGNLREGPVCHEFERRFAEQVGARYAVAVSSGTAALHIAYAAALQPGDEVLVPAFTFIATASMVSVVGAKPVFCDVDPETFTIDVEDARRRITSRTRAIAPVHLFGNPANVEAVQSLAREYGLTIIWDAAQAHGARYAGKDIGSFDDLVCYSFYPSKNMTTGEGGMITTNDEALYEKLRLLRSHGQAARYHHTTLGFNYRLTDVLASLGLYQLNTLGAWVKKRRENARYLSEHLQDIPGIKTPVEQPNGESSYNLYTVVMDPSHFTCTRDEFVKLLHAENIGAAIHYPRPLHKQPVYAQEVGELSLPVSETLSERVFSLPVHPHLTDEELAAIVHAVHKVAYAKRTSVTFSG